MKKLFILILLLATGILLPKAAFCEEDEIIPAFIELQYEQKPGGERTLTAILKDDHDEAPLKDILVNFYMGEISRDGWIGNATTDHDGKAVILLPNDLELLMDDEGEIMFIANSGEELYDIEAAEIFIKQTLIELSLNEEDSSVMAMVYIITPEGKVPAEDEEIQFLVKRSLGMLQISGEYSFADEEGFVEAEYPKGLPGDEYGNSTVIVRLADTESFGIASAEITVPWGTIPSVSTIDTTRALWAGKGLAPMWLVITVNSVIIGFWGTFIYVIYLLYQLKRQN